MSPANREFYFFLSNMYDTCSFCYCFLHWPGLPALCWIIVMRACSLTLLLIVGRRCSNSLPLSIGCQLLIDILCQKEEVCLYSYFPESFCNEWVLNFLKCFLCISWYHSITFLHQPVNTVDYIHNFWILNQSCISVINPTWSWYIFLYIP